MIFLIIAQLTARLNKLWASSLSQRREYSALRHATSEFPRVVVVDRVLMGWLWAAFNQVVTDVGLWCQRQCYSHPSTHHLGVATHLL